MGAAPSIGDMVRAQEERKYKKLEKLPPAVAEVKMRRMENEQLAVKFNREGGLHKFQEQFGESCDNDKQKCDGEEGQQVAEHIGHIFLPMVPVRNRHGLLSISFQNHSDREPPF